MLDVVLASCLELPEADLDEAPLLEALGAAGLESETWAWDDRGLDWSRSRMTLLRATWNYPLQPEAFARWVVTVAKLSQLWNPLPAVQWNLHKRYLLELERSGVPVVPTELVSKGSDETLLSIAKRRGWQRLVVKPAVSANSFDTVLVCPDDYQAGEAHLRSLTDTRDALVQPYLSSIETTGERSLIWIDGELTHAIRKGARFSGTKEAIRAVEFTPAEADLAERAVEAGRQRTGAELLYARIDMTAGPDTGGLPVLPVLMELELIEPSLYFVHSGAALVRFVEGVRARRPW